MSDAINSWRARSLVPGDVGAAATNYWGFQCCTEYGFFQTCEAGTDCFYARGLVACTRALHGSHSDGRSGFSFCCDDLFF